MRNLLILSFLLISHPLMTCESYAEADVLDDAESFSDFMVVQKYGQDALDCINGDPSKCKE